MAVALTSKPVGSHSDALYNPGPEATIASRTDFGTLAPDPYNSRPPRPPLGPCMTSSAELIETYCVATGRTA
jgi:hypothetical protein